MINYRDFVPADVTPMVAIRRRYETLTDLLVRANAWIRETGINVMNVETLLLPAGSAEKGDTRFTDNLQFDLGGIEIGGARVQVVRVWFGEA
jgi:hypothetical protein